jgi:hypothetical protein
VCLPDGPGLGIEPNIRAVKKYLVPVEIKVGDRQIFKGSEPAELD